VRARRSSWLKWTPPRIPKIDIESKCEEIGEPWSPVDLATVNDQAIRMALFHGERTHALEYAFTEKEIELFLSLVSYDSFLEELQICPIL
jgi:hypothetical protein